ncbi:MAG: flavodoxin family protein [Gammaproteobacteria bacterium]|nr:flavodoxin family protein [Gammaproteobacteria bacterium]
MDLNRNEGSDCGKNNEDFSKLTALFLNCTLKRSPDPSHTDGLISISKAIMQKNNVATEVIRPVDYDIAYGIYGDMTQHGWDKDDWPQLYQKVLAADILIVASPIWLGQISSVCKKIIERLYANSADLNNKGQYTYYGRAGGCIITGNEDGGKHCSMEILYSLQHLGYIIPPQADAYWVGEAGPGPSYCDKDSGGPENNFTNRNTTFMTWNLMHIANILKNKNGFPDYGNQSSKWNEGCRFD